MKIETISGKDAYSFKVEQNAQSIRLTNIKGDTLIRIDEESKELRSRNVYPEMSVHQIVDLVISMAPTSATVVYDKVADVYEEIVIPFAIDGVLRMSKTTWYKVELKAIANKSIDVFVNDAMTLGRALVVKRHTVDADDTELSIKSGASEVFIFEKGSFDKISFFVNDGTTSTPRLRKVEHSIEALLKGNEVAKTTLLQKLADGKENYINGLQFGLSVGVQSINEIMLHNPIMDEYFSIDYKLN